MGDGVGKVDPKRIPKTMQLFQVDLPILICSVGMIEDTDYYWREVIELCNDCYKKHNNDLAKTMINAIADYLESQSKKQKRK